MQEFEREIELIDYIEIVLKYKWLILLATVVCAVGAAVHTLRQPVYYEASAHLWVIPPENQTGRDTAIEPTRLTIENYKSIAMSGPIGTYLASFVDRLKGQDIEQGAGYSQSIKIANENGLILTVRSLNPKLPAPVVNAWTKEFMEQSKGMGVKETKKTYKFYVAQYDMARKFLEAKEDSLQRFGQQHQLGFLQREREAYEGQISSIQSQVISTHSNIEDQEYDLRRVQETVAAMEVDGTPFYLVPLVELQQLRTANELTKHIIANAVELETLKEARRQFAEEEQLALLEFDEQHGFELLVKKQDELHKTVDSYWSMILQAEGTKLVGEKCTKGLVRELEKHNAKLTVAKAIVDEELWAQIKGRLPSQGQVERLDKLKLYSEVLNPVYQDLYQKIAAQGVQYETALVLLEEGKQEVQILEGDLRKVNRNFYALQRKRNKLMGDLAQRRGNLDDQVKNLQTIYDSNRGQHLSQKGRLEELFQAMLAQKNQLQDLGIQQKLKRGIAKDRQVNLEKLQLDKTRLERDKTKYQDTFNKFASLIEDGRIAQEKEASNIRLIDPATGAGPTSESNPQKITISALAGLLISALLALLVEYIRNARASRSDAGGTVDPQ